jgi:hypothetical protein
LVCRNRKKISQIINDYICLTFFLIIILWYRGTYSMQYSGSKMLDYESRSVTMNYGSGPGLGPIFTFLSKSQRNVKKTSNFLKSNDLMLFNKIIFYWLQERPGCNPLAFFLLFYAPQLGTVNKEFYTLWLLYCWTFCLAFKIQ